MTDLTHDDLAVWVDRVQRHALGDKDATALLLAWHARLDAAQRMDLLMEVSTTVWAAYRAAQEGVGWEEFVESLRGRPGVS